MALAPDPVEQTRFFLARLGVSIADVRQAPLASAGIRGTPTLVVVDRSGRVIRSWRGFLSPEGEQEVVTVASSLRNRCRVSHWTGPMAASWGSKSAGCIRWPEELASRRRRGCAELPTLFAWLALAERPLSRP
jgi:hypothetical protein